MTTNLKKVDIVNEYLKTRLTINQKHSTDSHTHKRNPSIMQKKTIKPQKKKKETKNYKIS